LSDSQAVQNIASPTGGSEAAQGAGAKRTGSPLSSASFAKRPKWADKPVEPRLEAMPKEVIDNILDQVPNGGENRVTSLARTLKSLYTTALEKTRAKAKASDLIDRAKRIGTIRPATTHIGEFYRARLDEFRSILDSAKDPEIPLRGKDLTDVLIALAAETHNLGFSEVEGFNLMLETLEGLGSTWNKIMAIDPDDRKEEIHQLDQSRNEILHLLSRHSPPSDLDDEQKGECFDRLYAVLRSIETPEVKNKVVADMPLVQWYFWHPEHVGVARFGNLLQFVEDNLNDLTDSSKAKVVHNLTPKLAMHDEEADMTNDFNRLCGITESIDDDEAKADAATYLIERRDWLPEGDARTFVGARLAEIVATINDASIRARAEAVEPIPQTP